MLFLLSLAACVAESNPPSPDSASESTACAVTVAPVVEVTEMPTVLRVTWETETETTGQVRFAGQGQATRLTASTFGTTHEVLLVGLRPQSEVAFTLLVDGEVACGGEGTATTGSLNVGLPDVEPRISSPEAADAGLTAVSIIAGGAAAATLLDEEGVVVWAAAIEGAGRPVYRVLPSLDGESILYNETANSLEQPGVLYRVSLDGEVRESFMLPGGHTDFVEFAPHEYAMLGWDIREIEGRRLMGDTIVEFDESGNTRVVWSTFDSIEPDLTRQYDKGWYRDDPEVEDWTHVNGLSYDPEAGAYYVSITLDDSVARVDRASGEMTWRMGATVGDFLVEGGEPLFARPHSVQAVGNELVVFNRHTPREGSPDCGNAVRVKYDVEAGEVSRQWDYSPDECLPVEWLGSAQKLAGGGTLVCFSSAGQIDEVAPTGELAQSLVLPAGGQFGFAARLQNVGGGFPERP